MSFHITNLGCLLTGKLDKDHTFQIEFTPGSDKGWITNISKNTTKVRKVIVHSPEHANDSSLKGITQVFFRSELHVTLTKPWKNFFMKTVEVTLLPTAESKPAIRQLLILSEDILSDKRKCEIFVNLENNPEETIGNITDYSSTDRILKNLYKHSAIGLGPLEGMNSEAVANFLQDSFTFDYQIRLRGEKLIITENGSTQTNAIPQESKADSPKSGSDIPSHSITIQLSEKVEDVEVDDKALFPLEEKEREGNEEKSPPSIKIIKKYPNFSQSIFSVTNALELARYLSQNSESSILIELAKKMVDLYEIEPSEEETREMAALMPCLHGDNGLCALKKLALRYTTEFLVDQTILRTLTKLFVQFQSTHNHRLWIEGIERKTRSDLTNQNFLTEVKETFFLNLLRSLTNNLKSKSWNNSQLILDFLQVIVALLDVMTIKRIGNVPDEDHKAAYQAIAEYDDHEDLEISFRANYGKQAFTCITDDLSAGKTFLLHGFHLFSALATLADGVSPTEPWHIAKALVDSIPEFQRAFTFQDRPQRWFTSLIAIKKLVYLKSNVNFQKFSEWLKQTTREAKNNGSFEHIPTSNINFLMGLTHLASEVIESDFFDIEKKKISLTILKDIFQANGPGSPVKLLTLKPPAIGGKDRYKSSKKQLYTKLKDLLLSFSKNQNGEVKVFATNICHDLGIWDASNPVTEPLSTDLFQKAMGASPLFDSLTKIFQETMNPDSKSIYDLELGVNDPTSSKLSAQIQSFIDSTVNVLVLQGRDRIGKSIFMKNFSRKLLAAFKDRSSVFPIIIPLRNGNNSFDGVIDETFNSLAMLPLKPQFQQLKILWILDVHSNMTIDIDKVEHIFTANKLDLFPKSKLIIVTRHDKKPMDPHPKIKLLTVSLPLNWQEDFLKEFIQENNGHHHLHWHVDTYRDVLAALNPLENLLDSPFQFEVALKVLPGVLEELKKKEENKNRSFTEIAAAHTNLIKDKLIRTYCGLSAIQIAQKMDLDDMTPKAYLKNSFDLVRLMYRSRNNYSLPKQLADRDPDFKAFFSTEKPICPQLLELSYEGGNLYWKFIGNEYYDYLVKLSELEFGGFSDNIEKKYRRYTFY